MGDSNVAASSGPLIDTYQLAAGDHQQVVRIASATAITTNTWTVSLTASQSQIGADPSRVGVIMVNLSSGRVYLRFDNTAPTATNYHWYLEPGDRYEVPDELETLAISMLGTVANGTVNSVLSTAA